MFCLREQLNYEKLDIQGFFSPNNLNSKNLNEHVFCTASDKLMQVSFEIKSQTNCGLSYEPTVQFCAGDHLLKKDTCYVTFCSLLVFVCLNFWNSSSYLQGDSGGPLMTVGENNRFVFTGVVSFGDQACSGRGVYTNISNYYDWIVDHSHFWQFFVLVYFLSNFFSKINFNMIKLYFNQQTKRKKTVQNTRIHWNKFNEKIKKKIWHRKRILNTQTQEKQTIYKTYQKYTTQKWVYLDKGSIDWPRGNLCRCLAVAYSVCSRQLHCVVLNCWKNPRPADVMAVEGEKKTWPSSWTCPVVVAAHWSRSWRSWRLGSDLLVSRSESNCSCACLIAVAAAVVVGSGWVGEMRS